uniref:Reverse transcriptase domain-containing protein n=1 Tax=Tanacetum cinerariifolium TaxID=118510 RepID=A0A6L2NMK0_TANCI|nr:hypothetical protein [Tanacetum cinerariifolium]
MRDEYPIRTLGDYSKPSHEGYRNTIELPAGNNVVPLRSDTIRLVQNGCSLPGLRSKDPNQHLKIHHYVGGSYYPMPYLILSIEKDCKTPQRYLDVPTTSWRISIRSMYSVQGLTPKREEEISSMTKTTPGNTKKPTATEAEMLVIEAKTKNGAENEAKNKSIKTPENEETVEALDSITLDQELELERKKGKEYKVLRGGGPIYDAILKKKMTKKEYIRGNFKIPCSVRDVKHVNALVDQGFDVNIMPNSTCMKLTDERPAETDIRLLLASHSYIYHLGIDEDVLVEVAEYVYSIYFVILDIKENEKRPFILGTPFLKTAKASIKFDKGTITLRSGKRREEDENFLEQIGGVLRSCIQRIIPSHIHMQEASEDNYGVLDKLSLDSRKLGLNSRCEASLAKLSKYVVKLTLTHLRSKIKKEASEDDNGVLDKLILDSRKLGLNSKYEASLVKLAKDVVKSNLTHLRFWVKKGLVALVSAGSGSDGPIRSIQVMHMAYWRFKVDTEFKVDTAYPYPYLQFLEVSENDNGVLDKFSLDSRKLGLNSRCEASLAKLAKDVVKSNLTHLRFNVKKVRPWIKAHDLRD